jgi:hypothetical protein
VKCKVGAVNTNHIQAWKKEEKNYLGANKPKIDDDDDDMDDETWMEQF